MFLVPQVFLSTRRGAWILNRVGNRGYPIDVLVSSRLYYFLSKICGQSLANTFMERRLNQRFDHEMFGLKPKHRYVLKMGVGSGLAEAQE
jgi:dimethylaniline monooxygenase (N-oxide forming)